MTNLIEKVIDWANERSLVKPYAQYAQTVKLSEELGEISRAILKEDHDALKDGIGDVLVVLIILCAQKGIDIRPFFSESNFAKWNESYRFYETHKEKIFDWKYGFVIGLQSDVGLISQSIYKLRLDSFTDQLKETLISLHHLAKQHDLTLEECLQAAYDEIKDRKGQTINGTFIKQQQ
jgi:NTP pyrophosphatase (non-canonical NTP hydrolase)